MEHDPQETRRLLEGEAPHEDAITNRTTDDFNRDVAHAKQSLLEAEEIETSTLIRMADAKERFEHAINKTDGINADLESNKTVLYRLKRRAYCGRLCLWASILILVVVNLIVLYFFYIREAINNVETETTQASGGIKTKGVPKS